MNIQNIKRILLIVVAVIALIFGKQFNNPKGHVPKNNTPKPTTTQNPTTQNPTTAPPSNTNSVLEKMRHQQIVYTKHAKCRMDCRHITEAEINEILEKGTINNRKSEPNAQPCPTYAVEGYTHQRQQVRIVFANCPSTTKVITAIDIGEDHPCGKCD